MAGPKPLPFDRVRVMVLAEAGVCQWADRRRALPPPRRLLENPWLDRADHGAEPIGASPREPVALRQVDVVAGRQPTAVPVQPVDSDGSLSAAAVPLEEPMPSADGEVPPPNDDAQKRSAAADARRGSGGSVGSVNAVTAVARAVEEATLVKALVALLVDTCSVDASRETGPWDFTLELADLGLGRSSVHLHLSYELLSLRFQCHGPGVARLLSKHRDMLLMMLDDELPEPLQIEIVIAEHTDHSARP